MQTNEPYLRSVSTECEGQYITVDCNGDVTVFRRGGTGPWLTGPEANDPYIKSLLEYIFYLEDELDDALGNDIGIRDSLNNGEDDNDETDKELPKG